MPELFDTGTHLSYRICDPFQFSCAGNPQRADVVEKLNHLSGKHLVIVRYAELHNPHNEWVFNGADIDGGKIVWARDMGPAQNEKLLTYFKDRQAWVVMPDEASKQIIPYSPSLLATNGSERKN